MVNWQYNNKSKVSSNFWAKKLLGPRNWQIVSFVILFFGHSGHLPSSFNCWRWIENAQVLVRYCTLSWISIPKIWTSLMRSGQAVESRINLTWLSGEEPSILRMRPCSGQSVDKLCSLCLVCSSAVQTISRCTRSPFKFWQVSDKQYPLLFVDQNLHSASVLYCAGSGTVHLEHSKL